MGEYKQWGCVYWCPPETETGDRVNDIPRDVIARQLGNLKGLPVDTFHNPKNAVGYVSDAYQCSTHGSLFVEVAIPRGKPVNDITIGLIETGKLKGLSLAHDPSTLDRKIVSVGLTPHPGRRNTVFLPSASGPTAQRSISRLAMFSEFDMLERQEMETSKKMSEQQPPAVQQPATPAVQPPANQQPPPTQPPAAQQPPPPAQPPAEITDEQQLAILNDLAKSPDESVRMMAQYSLQQHNKNAQLSKELEGARSVVEQQTGEVKEWISNNWTRLANIPREKQEQLKEAEQTLLNAVATDPTLRAAVYKIQQAQKTVSPPPPPPQPDRVTQSLTQPSQSRIDQLTLARSLMNRDTQGRFTSVASQPSKTSNPSSATPLSSYATNQMSRAAATNPAPLAAFSGTEAEQNALIAVYQQNREKFGNVSTWSGVQVIQDRDWKTFTDPRQMLEEDENRSRLMY
jgi:hypothetical protein